MDFYLYNYTSMLPRWDDNKPTKHEKRMMARKGWRR